MSLVGVFLLLSLGPTVWQLVFGGASWALLGPSRLVLFCVAFFVFCVLRVVAVYGMEAIVEATAEDERRRPGTLVVATKRWAQWVFQSRGWLTNRGKQIGLIWDVAMLALIFLALTSFDGWWPKVQHAAHVIVLDEASPNAGVVAGDASPKHAQNVAPNGGRTFSDVLTALVWALPAIGVGLLVQSANRFLTVITDLYEKEGTLARLHELARLGPAGRAYAAQFERLFGSESTLRRLLPHFEAADAAVERAIERTEDAMERRRQDYVKRSAATIAVAGFIGTLGPIAALKPDDVKTNHASDILAEFFDKEAPTAPVQETSIGGQGAAFAGTVEAEAAAPASFDPCRNQGRLLAEGMRIGNRKEILDEDAEVLAFALGQVIRCAEIVGSERVVYNFWPVPVSAAGRIAWRPAMSSLPHPFDANSSRGDVDRMVGALQQEWEKATERAPFPLDLPVQPKLVDGWPAAFAKALEATGPVRVPSTATSTEPLATSPLPRDQAIPANCNERLASFYFRQNHGALAGMVCGAMQGATCRADKEDTAAASLAVEALRARIVDEYDFLLHASETERRQMLFVGYTDSTGYPSANTRLAHRRAISVRQALGLEGFRASAIGRGEAADPAGLMLENGLSRRVDVYFCGEPGGHDSADSVASALPPSVKSTD